MSFKNNALWTRFIVFAFVKKTMLVVIRMKVGNAVVAER
jgi:hypothetical protein